MADPTSNPGSTGAGQQDPFDSNSDFAVMSFIVRQMVSQLDTMKLVKVTNVTGGGIAVAGTVDVQLLVNQLDGSGNSTPNGTVYGIPWLRLGAGKTAIICDPVVGDVGYVVCSDRDISNVKAKKGQANPGSYRRYNVSDGVYVGSLFADAPEQYLRFTEDTIEVHDKTGNVVKLSPTGIELTPSGINAVKVNGSLIVTGNLLLGGSVLANPSGGVYDGNFITSGNVVSQGKDLATHKHSQAADSHGDTEEDTSSPL